MSIYYKALSSRYFFEIYVFKREKEDQQKISTSLKNS